MFIVRRVHGIVQTVPILSLRNAASDNLERLERGCGRLPPRPSTNGRELRKSFDRIELRPRHVPLVHKSTEAVFQWGRWIFTLRFGDLVFITGGTFGQIDAAEVALRPVSADSGEILLRRGACRPRAIAMPTAR